MPGIDKHCLIDSRLTRALEGVCYCFCCQTIVCFWTECTREDYRPSCCVHSPNVSRRCSWPVCFTITMTPCMSCSPYTALSSWHDITLQCWHRHDVPAARPHTWAWEQRPLANPRRGWLSCSLGRRLQIRHARLPRWWRITVTVIAPTALAYI